MTTSTKVLMIISFICFVRVIEKEGGREEKGGREREGEREGGREGERERERERERALGETVPIPSSTRFVTLETTKFTLFGVSTGGTIVERSSRLSLPTF